jgi:hypothetical protein
MVDIGKLIVDTGDAVVGVVGEDSVKMGVEVVVSREDLAECMSAIALGVPVFYGAFPSRDDDGVRAVTMTLPDRDGIVRNHPH